MDIVSTPMSTPAPQVPIQPINPDVSPQPGYSPTPALDRLQDAYRNGLVNASDIMGLVSQASNTQKTQAVNAADIQAAKLRQQTQPPEAAAEIAESTARQQIAPATAAATVAQQKAAQASAQVSETTARANIPPANLALQESQLSPTGDLTRLREGWTQRMMGAPVPLDSNGNIDYKLMSDFYPDLGSSAVDLAQGKVKGSSLLPGTGITTPTPPSNPTLPSAPPSEEVNPHPGIPVVPKPGIPRGATPVAAPLAIPESAKAIMGNTAGAQTELSDFLMGRTNKLSSNPMFTIGMNNMWWGTPTGDMLKQELTTKNAWDLLRDSNGNPRPFWDVWRDAGTAQQRYTGDLLATTEKDYTSSVADLQQLNRIRSLISIPGMVGKKITTGDIIGQKYAELRAWLGYDPQKYSTQAQLDQLLNAQKQMVMQTVHNIRNQYEFNAVTGSIPTMDDPPDVWQNWLNQGMTQVGQYATSLRGHIPLSQVPGIPAPSQVPVAGASSPVKAPRGMAPFAGVVTNPAKQATLAKGTIFINARGRPEMVQ